MTARVDSTGRTDRTSRIDRTGPAPLVVVFLRGGMDGLSMLRPLEDQRLDELRGPLAVPPSAALDVGDGFGLHPAMARTAKRFADGSVALIPAIGLPGATRSHFEAQFAVERCSTAPSATGGWLGRHLAATAGSEPDPFRGVSIGQPQVPVSLSGTGDALAARSMGDLSLQTPSGGSTSEALSAALRAVWTDDGGPLGASAGAAFDVLGRAASNGPTSSEPVGGGRAGGGPARRRSDRRSRRTDPSTGATATGDGGAATEGAAAADGSGSSVAEVVSLFGSGLGTEVAMVNLGGWDDHNDLGVIDGAFADRAAALDSALDQLVTGIPGVTVLVVSEFGRRAATNDSSGCDHGRGGVAMLLGEKVHGGVHGDWPGLDDLDEGDVRTATDIRAVFAAVVDRVLAGDPERTLPDGPAAMRGLLA